MISLWIAPAWALETSIARFNQAPPWLKASRVERLAARIQKYLQWDVRRVEVVWHSNASEFERGHKMGPSVLAYARKQDNSVHVGPAVTTDNFEKVFGHELVHVILFQKYKQAIPRWLEEGLASFVPGGWTVDYPWLASQTYRPVATLTHPFVTGEATISADGARYHYLASLAAAQMIARKCGDMEDVLQLAVGKKLETYLGTTCEIRDVDRELQAWIQKNAKRTPGRM